MARRNRIAVLLGLLAVASWIIFADASGPPDLTRVLATRDTYHRLNSEEEQLLGAISRRRALLAFSNQSGHRQSIDSTGLFFTSNRIEQSLRIHDRSVPSERAQRIFDLVARSHVHRHPLFESNVLHAPDLYLSAFGAGYCDDAATLIVELSRRTSLSSRTVWLDDSHGACMHVVAETFHDDKWRVYDADQWGVYKGSDGLPVDLEMLLRLAPKMGVGLHRSHKLVGESLDQTRRSHAAPLTLNLAPEERWMFLPQVFLLTSDGRYPRGGWKHESKLSHYADVIGNLIRVIPLSRLASFNSELVFESAFPIMGAFLLTSQPVGCDRVPLSVRVDSKYLNDDVLSPLCHHRHHYVDHMIYVNLNGAIRTLEGDPSFRLTLSGAVENWKQVASLVVVHPFARNNLDTSKGVVERLKSMKFEIESHSLLSGTSANFFN